ncbi:MAG: AMP-binding protein [Balneolales bacterium]
MNQFPWQTLYPDGIPFEINPAEYGSLADVLDEACQKYADLPAFENMGVSYTYRELDRLTLHFATYLQQNAGLKKGDHIAVQMPNLLQYPIALFGALRAGLVVVNTNPLYTAREMEFQFRDSGVKAVVIAENFAHKLEQISDKVSIDTVIITGIGDQLGGLRGSVVNFVIKYFKRMVPSYHLPEAVTFKEVLSAGAGGSFDPVMLTGDDIAFLQYTGGTTGRSKGAILTHRNMVANLLQCRAWFTGLKAGRETVITALPLYHIFALTVNGLLMLNIGARNILITNPRDLKTFISELKKHPFTIFTGLNTLFNALLNQKEFKKINFKTLKVTVGGGMAVQKSVAERWKEVTGKMIVEGYGLTEASPVLSCNPVDESGRLGTIGLPLPSTELAILDEEGNLLPPGQPGEIVARGPQVMKGYWKQEEESRHIFLDDWLKTGDIGVMKDDGYFTIVDRKKDMINVSGFNVYPNEVEDVIAAHPKVTEVGVIGVVDDHSGEVVKAFIVRKVPTLTEEEIRQYCKENLTGYKRPKYVVFKDELPKNPVGKILRKELRELDA